MTNNEIVVEAYCRKKIKFVNKKIKKLKSLVGRTSNEAKLEVLIFSTENELGLWAKKLIKYGG